MQRKHSIYCRIFVNPVKMQKS